MKIVINVKSLLILIYCFVAHCTIIAQNQSLLLPIPGGTSDDYDGCKMINFINPSNTSISTLPKWKSYIIGHSGDPDYLVRPHYEQDLQLADPSMNEKYLGQHPMFAQQVVHDKDGNLLFFIVDNNIYNRHGEAFVLYEDGLPATGLYTYLYGDASGNLYNRFGFSDPVSLGGTLGPEIIIFPIYGATECYTFGLVFSIYRQNASSGAEGVYYRTLTYYDETHIELSDITNLSTNFDPQSGCYNNANASMAITDYRPYDANANYILFVHYYNKLIMMPITNWSFLNKLGSNA